MTTHADVDRTSGKGRVARAVADLLTTPFAVSDYLDEVNPVRRGAPLRGRVVGKVSRTPDVATVTIAPSPAWVGHEAGQFVRVGVDVDGVRHWRSYTISSRSSGRCDPFEITVKAHRVGGVSDHLVHHAQIGEVVQLEAAAGDFGRLPATTSAAAQSEPAERGLLFIAGGSGITPFMSLLSSGISCAGEATLVYSSRHREQVIFGDELRRLAAAGALHLHEHFSAESGHFSFDQLDDLVPDWRERTTFVCGPAGMIDAALAHWQAHDVADRISFEAFQLRPAVVGEGGTVTFTGSGKVVAAPGDQPLLVVGETADVPMPSGCRMGICFGCVSTLTQGAVRDVRTGEITTATHEPVSIQTCVSTAAGDCHIQR